MREPFEMVAGTQGARARSRAGTGSLLLALLVSVLGTLALVLVGNRPGSLALEAGGGAGALDAPAPVLFTEEALQRILEPISHQVQEGAFPGGVLAVGIGDREIRLAGMGHIGWTRNAGPADPLLTRYDLASLTKVVATASAVLLLVEERRMWLDDPAWIYLPEFAEGPKAGVTIRHLLTHTSGVPAGAILRGETREARIARATRLSIYPPAGARVAYSDVGYVLLWEAAQRAAGEPLPEYLERRLYRPLGMNSTGFSPGLDCEACAPTGRLRDQSLYRGRPFDPTAQSLGGISGNAGLFSTAHDLARFAAMVTNRGELDGVRVFQPETIREFIGPQPVGGRYRLGWEVFCEGGTEEERAGCDPPLAIGHNGWTGTSLWIEPERGIWLVLLTNRTYEPKAPNQLQQTRREVFARATGSGFSAPDQAEHEPLASARRAASERSGPPLGPRRRGGPLRPVALPPIARPASRATLTDDGRIFPPAHGADPAAPVGPILHQQGSVPCLQDAPAQVHPPHIPC